MKKDTYRWREMKNEKPSRGEIVICAFGDGVNIPYDEGGVGVCTYWGKLEADEDDHEWVLIQHHMPGPGDHIKEMYISPSILWRKMCKLPGE